MPNLPNIHGKPAIPHLDNRLYSHQRTDHNGHISHSQADQEEAETLARKIWTVNPHLNLGRGSQFLNRAWAELSQGEASDEVQTTSACGRLAAVHVYRGGGAIAWAIFVEARRITDHGFTEQFRGKSDYSKLIAQLESWETHKIQAAAKKLDALAQGSKLASQVEIWIQEFQRSLRVDSLSPPSHSSRAPRIQLCERQRSTSPSSNRTRDHSRDIQQSETPQPKRKRDDVNIASNIEARTSRQDLFHSLQLPHAHYGNPSLEALGTVLPKDFLRAVVRRRHYKHGYSASAFLEFTKAPTTSTDPELPLLEAQLHLEIHHDELPGLAQRLLNVHVKSSTITRSLVFPNGLDVIPSPCLVISGGQFGAVSSHNFGELLHEAITTSESYKDDILQQLPSTKSISLAITADPASSGLLVLHLDFQLAAQIKKKLFPKVDRIISC